MMMCTRCKKRPAVMFISAISGTERTFTEAELSIILITILRSTDMLPPSILSDIPPKTEMQEAPRGDVYFRHQRHGEKERGSLPFCFSANLLKAPCCRKDFSENRERFPHRRAQTEIPPPLIRKSQPSLPRPLLPRCCQSFAPHQKQSLSYRRTGRGQDRNSGGHRPKAGERRRSVQASGQGALPDQEAQWFRQW